jgi:hypothetical protein
VRLLQPSTRHACFEPYACILALAHTRVILVLARRTELDFIKCRSVIRVDALNGRREKENRDQIVGVRAIKIR